MIGFSLVLADLAEEGRDIITVMLVVGLIFIAVILLGDGLERMRHRRRHQ